MDTEKKGHTTIIKPTDGDLQSFIGEATAKHDSFAADNIIIDILSVPATLKDIKLFADLSKMHRKGKKSFVIAAQGIDFNAVPAKIDVVPSLTEAHDIIEMEEIERDLGF